jgi:hypothetical protein
MSASMAEMGDKLLTLEDLYVKLEATEPLTAVDLTSEAKVRFRFDPDWAVDLDVADTTEDVRAYMTVDGTERQMTKAGALQAAANFGLSAALVKKLPSKNLEADLNYFYAGGFEDKEFKVLSVADKISAFTRPTLTPFSNIRLLDETLYGIYNRFGEDSQVFADYKFLNNLQRTDIRLVVPEFRRVLTDTGMTDIPADSEDIWHGGLHLSNSAIGKTQTSLEAYLFRWWCTNGATTTNRDVGLWSRRSDGQQEDVYLWARESVDEIFDGMTERFDQVQALTSLDVAKNTGDVLREIFSQYSVPVSQRDQVQQAVIEADRLTMYTLMNAITQTANDPELKPERADQLMRIGGSIPTDTFDTLKAQVWREGNSADKAARNPYEIAPV